MSNDLIRLSGGIKKFVKDRDWEQFHTPKNLSMSISIEAAELMEHFQWTNTVDEAIRILKDKQKDPKLRMRLPI